VRYRLEYFTDVGIWRPEVCLLNPETPERERERARKRKGERRKPEPKPPHPSKL
jgi:hypothetical protein